MEGELLKAGCLSPEVNRGELWLYHSGKWCRCCSQSLGFLICKMGEKRIVVRAIITPVTPHPEEVLRGTVVNIGFPGFCHNGSAFTVVFADALLLVIVEMRLALSRANLGGLFLPCGHPSSSARPFPLQL